MAKLNIYKIDSNKRERLKNEVLNTLQYIEEKEIKNPNGRKFKMKLYIQHKKELKTSNWDWILEEFEQEQILLGTNPKAILEIQMGDILYVITFGCAHF